MINSDSIKNPRTTAETKTQKQWFFTSDAAIELDLPAEKLRELYRNGMFQMGFHIRDVSAPKSKRPTLQFHVERCSKQLETPPEKRKQY